MTGIGLLGASGRMGRAIASLLEEEGSVRLAESCDRGGDPHDVARSCDVLVDFSAPDALTGNLEAALAAGKPIVIGTTGLDAEQETAIRRAAEHVPVLRSANMSLGVNLVAALVRDAAARLGPEWDVEIVEMHHRHKVDAPSGTALMLGAAAAAGRGVELAAAAERGRDGPCGPRRPGAIGFASLRGGSVAGDHQAIFATEGERIEIGHRAEGREVFARGALKAAEWLQGKPPGLYSIKDVLGLP